MRNVAILQFDDRSDRELNQLRALIGRNEQYAGFRGYHHAFVRTQDKDLPQYWYKVFLLEQYLAEFEIVVWLDSDAVMHDFNVGPESLFQGQESFVYASDVPIWEEFSPFNAGVMFCKGSFARALMQEWQTHYPAHAWRKNGGQWNVDEHVWAGQNFEQGSFVDKVLPKYARSPYLKQLNWKVLQSPYPTAESLTLHFPKHLRMNSFIYLHELFRA